MTGRFMFKGTKVKVWVRKATSVWLSEGLCGEHTEEKRVGKHKTQEGRTAEALSCCNKGTQRYLLNGQANEQAWI